MLYSYIKTAFKTITRNKLSTIVNIAGLSLGICAFLFLAQYISLERSVNRFHANLPHIYRLINKAPSGDTWPEIEPGFAFLIKQHFPEITNYCRFNEESGATIVSKKDDPEKVGSEKLIGYADGNFFSFFSFPLLLGDKASLSKPNTVFVSAKTAEKYFGKDNPLGKVLVLNNQFGKTDYTVEGVFADMGENSDIKYNLLFSLETLRNPANLNGNDWASLDNLNSQFISTFFYLDNNVDVKKLENKLTVFRTGLKSQKDGVQFKLQPLADMHLGSSFNDSYPTYSNLKYVYMLGAITLLILLIAWFNYINLSTAYAFKRANEVGIRKVIGASKKNLVFQFLTESFIINITAFLFALVLVYLLQPLFNDLIGRELSLQVIGSSSNWVYILLLLFSGSLLSGIYTAFVLAGFKPIQTIKGKISKTTKGVFLRKSLVVSQFAISIILIMATILIESQLHFMQHKNLGINPSQLLVIRGPQVGQDSNFKQRRSAFQNELKQESFVTDFCATGSIPSGHYNFTTSGFTIPGSKNGDEVKTYSFAIINDRFLPTYQIPLIAGRNFTAPECDVEWNNNSKVLMNETAIKQLGFNNTADALKTPVQWHERPLYIIGIVKDYNHLGLQHAIEPMIFYPQNNPSYFTIRLSPNKLDQKISSLHDLYKTSFPGNPFEYFFVDEHYQQLYQSEMQYANIFTIASAWAIFIACLGLFGLVSFTVELRTKEIGVRKVLGASVTNIVSMISKEFLWLVLIAFVIASPIAWYFMNKWLESFAYHIHVGWWIFGLAGFLAMLIAFATVSLRTINSAKRNPVKSLRTE